MLAETFAFTFISPLGQKRLPREKIVIWEGKPLSNFTKSSTRSLRKLRSFKTEAEKTAWLAGGRVTVGILGILDEERKQIKTFFVPKVRGVIIATSGEGRFETEEEARLAGRRILAKWKEEENG